MKNNILLILHKLTNQNSIGEVWRCPVCIFKNPYSMTAQEKDQMEWIQCSMEECGVWVHMDCEDDFSGKVHDWKSLLLNQEDFNYECPMCRDKKFLANLMNKCGMYKVTIKRSESYDSIESLRKQLVSKKRISVQNQNYSYIDSDSYKNVENLILQTNDIDPLYLSEEEMLRDFADFNAYADHKIFHDVDEDGNRIKPVVMKKRFTKNFK